MFKCGEFGHYDYQCSSKSQHTDDVQIDDIDNSRIVEDVHIHSVVTNNVDELVKTSTPARDETHVHESISDVQNALVKSSTPALDETHVHEESISDVHDALVESSTPSHGVMCSLSAPKSLGCLPIVC